MDTSYRINKFFPLLWGNRSNGFMHACIISTKYFSVINIHFEQTKDILLVKILHGPSMLAGMPILVSALWSKLLSVLRKHLVIVQISCSLFIIGQPTGSKPSGIIWHNISNQTG